jgi:SAM-dependent methyltransferase
VHASIYTITDQERMAHAANYFAWQGRLVAPRLGQRVIEVGCGIGNFTRMLLDREVVVAVDVDPACVERLRERYPNRPNLQAFVCDPSSGAFADLARFRADSCVCLNVLEHIADDGQALDAMASVLAPRGVIVLLVPAFPALCGPIDRNLNHYRRYSRDTLAALADRTGLRVEKLHYVNAIGFFAWWINAHVFRREAQSETQIRVFDRYVVPWLSRLEAMAPPPFGQSLFAVLRKP